MTTPTHFPSGERSLCGVPSSQTREPDGNNPPYRASEPHSSEGWVQGTSSDFIDGKYCRCAWAALGDAAEKIGQSGYGLAHRMLRLAARTSHQGGIVVWNDTPGRTQAEVLAAFDKAIEMAKKESV